MENGTNRIVRDLATDMDDYVEMLVASLASKGVTENKMLHEMFKTRKIFVKSFVKSFFFMARQP
jgi:hypothetical protein